MSKYNVTVSCGAKIFTETLEGHVGSSLGLVYLDRLKASCQIGSVQLSDDGKYTVSILCEDRQSENHQFNVKGVKASNSDDAGNKALKLIKRMMKVESVVEEKDDCIDYFMNIFGMKK